MSKTQAVDVVETVKAENARLEQEVKSDASTGAAEIRQSIFDSIPENVLEIIENVDTPLGARLHLSSLVIMRDKSVDHLESILTSIEIKDKDANNLYAKSLTKLSATKKYKFYKPNIEGVMSELGSEYVVKFKKLIGYLAQVGLKDSSSLLTMVTKYGLTMHNDQEKATFKQLLDYVK